MRLKKFRKIIFCVAISLALYGGQWIGRMAIAQNPPAAASPPAGSGAAGLQLQRSVAIYNFKTTGESGPKRGEEIYYIKCWMCHNKYTIAAKTGAVPLKDLYQRPRLINGQPVNDQTVAEKIKTGSPVMPAYRYALSDADLADLLSYLKDVSCCFEGDEPPRNPAYRY